MPNAFDAVLAIGAQPIQELPAPPALPPIVPALPPNGIEVIQQPAAGAVVQDRPRGRGRGRPPGRGAAEPIPLAGGQAANDQQRGVENAPPPLALDNQVAEAHDDAVDVLPVAGPAVHVQHDHGPFVPGPIPPALQAELRRRFPIPQLIEISSSEDEGEDVLEVERQQNQVEVALIHQDWQDLDLVDAIDDVELVNECTICYARECSHTPDGCLHQYCVQCLNRLVPKRCPQCRRDFLTVIPL